MNSEDAQILALQALTFLAEDGERIDGFLRMTGTQPAELRAIATSKGGLAAILEYLLGNESLLLAFTAHAECPDDAPARAHCALTHTQGAARQTADWT